MDIRDIREKFKNLFSRNRGSSNTTIRRNNSLLELNIFGVYSVLSTVIIYLPFIFFEVICVDIIGCDNLLQDYISKANYLIDIKEKELGEMDTRKRYYHKGLESYSGDKVLCIKQEDSYEYKIGEFYHYEDLGYKLMDPTIGVYFSNTVKNYFKYDDFDSHFRIINEKEYLIENRLKKIDIILS